MARGGRVLSYPGNTSYDQLLLMTGIIDFSHKSFLRWYSPISPEVAFFFFLAGQVDGSVGCPVPGSGSDGQISMNPGWHEMVR